MDTLRGRKVNRGIITTATLLVLLSFLTGCFEQQYTVVKLQAKEISVDRSLEMSASDNLYKPTVKVVFVVDNSSSMKMDQLLLGDGITTFLNEAQQLKEVNVDFYVFTTTSHDSDLSKPKAIATVSSTPFLFRGLTPLSSVPLAIAGGMDYQQVWPRQISPLQFTNSSTGSSLGDHIELRVGMDPLDFQNASDAISYTIKNVGTNGSDTEAGLCTIGRILAEDTSANFLKVVNGEKPKVAFVVITDDNDYSVNADCLKKQWKNVPFVTTTPPPTTTTIPTLDSVSPTYATYQMTYTTPGTSGTPATYSFSYDYSTGDQYTLNYKYALKDAVNSGAKYQIEYRNSYNYSFSSQIAINPIFAAQCTYYKKNCTYDSKPNMPCVYNETYSGACGGYTFSLSDFGTWGISKPTVIASTGTSTCPDSLKTHLQNNILPFALPPSDPNAPDLTRNIIGCTYAFAKGGVSTLTANSNNTASISTASTTNIHTLSGPLLGLTDTGSKPTPLTNDCSDPIKNSILSYYLLNGTSTIPTADNLVFFSDVGKKCTYTYTETTLKTAATSFTPPSTLVGSGTAIACPTTWAIVTGQTYGSLYRGCTYSYSNIPISPASAVSFTPSTANSNFGLTLPLTTNSSGATSGTCTAALNTLAANEMTNLLTSQSKDPNQYSVTECTYNYQATGYNTKTLSNIALATANGFGINTTQTIFSSCMPHLATSNGTSTFQTWLWSQAGKSGGDSAPRTCSFKYVYGASGTPPGTFTSTNVFASQWRDSNVAKNYCAEGQNGTISTTDASFFATKLAAPVGATPQWNSCNRKTWKDVATTTTNDPVYSYGSPSATTSVTVKDALDSTAVDLQTAIFNRSSQLFDKDGFFFAGIINMQADTFTGYPKSSGNYKNSFINNACDPIFAAGQGEKYYQLIDKFGDSAFAQSICQNDYSPTLQSITDFIVRTSSNSYLIPLEIGDVIEEVGVRHKDENTMRILVRDVDYWINLQVNDSGIATGAIVKFKAGEILADDYLTFKRIKYMKVKPDPIE